MHLLESTFGSNSTVLNDRDYQLLLIATTTGPLGTTLVSPILDSLRQPYGVTEAQMGWFIAVYTAPAIVLILLQGLLVDRYGRKPILVSGLLLFGLGGICVSFTTDFRLALASRFLQGVGGAGIVPVIVTSIGDLYEGTAETTAQGLRFTISGLISTVAPLLAGFLVAFAWFYPLWIYALAIPIAATVFVYFEEPGLTDGRETGRSLRTQVVGMWQVIHDRTTLLVLLARLFPALAYFSFITYSSVLVIRVLDGTPAVAGLVVAVLSLTFAITSSQAGRALERFGGSLGPLVLGNVALGVGLCLVSVTDSVYVVLAAMLPFGIGFGLLLSIYRSLITGLGPSNERGRLVSVAEAVDRVGATTAPLVTGFAVTALQVVVGQATGLRVTLFALGVFCCVAGVGCTISVRSVLPGYRLGTDDRHST